MPTIRLTQLAADKLVPPATGRIVYWDRHLPGFGMRVTSKSGAWKPKTAKEWRRIFEHDVLPGWGERPLAGITKADVLELVNDKAGKRERKRKGVAATAGAAVQAGKMLTRLRTFFGWAA